jgi:hypothetical protein
MATSGSIDFIVNRDQIIQEALEQLGVIAPEDTPTPSQITSASRTLNMMIKTWQADKMNLFAVDRCVVFVEKGQEKYTLNDTTTDNFTKLSQLNQTTISVAGLSAALTINVDDASSISDGDFIGIASGTDVFWTTVDGAPVGDLVTLTDPLPEDQSVGDIVWSYTTKANRPMKIMEGYIHQTQSNTDIPLGNLSRRKYDSLTRKDNQGRINQFYYDPQRAAGNLYVWPTGADETNYVLLIVQRTLEDLDSSTDDPDFPQEWLLPLALNLAMLLADKYGVPDDIAGRVTSKAQYYYEICKDWDDELYTSVFLTPDNRGEDL